MLPTLRLILAGVSALFLVTLGTLSLTQPSTDRMPTRVATASFAPRGAMISADDHPEWRQFRAQAALRRADELARLRELPDQPDANAAQLHWVSLPAGAEDHAPAEAIEALGEVPPATMDVDIGEASAAELPVVPEEETVPPPIRAKDAKDARQSSLAPDAAAPNSAPDASPTASVARAVTKPAAAKPAAAKSRPAVASKKKPRRTVRRKEPAKPAETNPFASLFSANGAQTQPATLAQ